MTIKSLTIFTIDDKEVWNIIPGIYEYTLIGTLWYYRDDGNNLHKISNTNLLGKNNLMRLNEIFKEHYYLPIGDQLEPFNEQSSNI